MFNGALVQFLVPPEPYMSLGRDAEFCVHYSSPTLRNAIHFEEYPKQSVVVWSQSRPDPLCVAPDEKLSIKSIIPTETNPRPALVTGCDDHSEIRAYIGSQIVGRVAFDIITPKKESSEIIEFRNDFSKQVTGIPNLSTPCLGNPYCLGYQHKIYAERGPDSQNRQLDLPPRAMFNEKITDVSDSRTKCAPGAALVIQDAPANSEPGGRFWVKDFNGYSSNIRSLPIRPNCTDLYKQEIKIGKCRFANIGIAQRVRTINGSQYMFMDRTDHDTNTRPYPVEPP